MKTTLLLIILYKLNMFSLYAEDLLQIDSIQYYMIDLSSKTVIAYNSENIKQYCFYSFIDKQSDLNNSFNDSSNLLLYLKSGKTLNKNSGNIRYLVVLNFNNSKLPIAFDEYGNHLINGIWYHRDNYLFYNLFKYFSGLLVNKKILRKSKKE